jgi:hypothetical protein
MDDLAVLLEKLFYLGFPLFCVDFAEEWVT